MNTIGLIVRIINILLMVGLPCLAVLILYRRGPGGFRPIWIGALAFVLSQVAHIPFNQFLLLPGLQALGVDLKAQAGISLITFGLAVGLSAGVFEEVTRYLVFRYWLKRDTGTLLPVKYGIGHGGVEAVLAGLLALLALVQVLIYSGSGAAKLLPPDQAELARSQIEMYWAVPWGQSLLGAWERVSAMAFHLGASLLVYKSVRGRNPLWLVIAILGHTVLDAFAVIGVAQLNVFLLEGLIFVFAAAWTAWCWSVRLRELPAEPDPPAPDLLSDLPAPEVTSQQIEESRYE